MAKMGPSTAKKINLHGQKPVREDIGLKLKELREIMDFDEEQLCEQAGGELTNIRFNGIQSNKTLNIQRSRVNKEILQKLDTICSQGY